MPEHHFSGALALIGLWITLLWWVGAAYAYWRRRWMLTAAFFLAGLVGIVFSYTAAGSDIPRWLEWTASLARGPVAAMFVASFIFNQPRGSSRPTRWSP